MEKVTLEQFLKKHKIIVLDTMVFIYQFEAHPIFSKTTHAIFTAIERKKCRAVISTITLHETLVKPKKENNYPLALKYQHMLAASPFLTLVDVTPYIADMAAGVRVKYNFTAPNAIIAATGLAQKATGIVTADKKIALIEEMEAFIIR